MHEFLAVSLIIFIPGQPDFWGGRRRDPDREQKAGVRDQRTAVHQGGECGEGSAVPHCGNGPGCHREAAHDAGGQLRTGRSGQGWVAASENETAALVSMSAGW